MIAAPRSRTVIPAAAVTDILGRYRQAPMPGGPGTTCGNHRAHSPGHPRTPLAMVSAAQADELPLAGWVDSRSYFALQARGHRFEPCCAHWGRAAKTVPHLRQRGGAPSFALRLATAVPGWRRPVVPNTCPSQSVPASPLSSAALDRWPDRPPGASCALPNRAVIRSRRHRFAVPLARLLRRALPCITVAVSR